MVDIHGEERTGVNVMQNIPNYEEIVLSFWSANESELYISGSCQGNPVSYKVDLSTLEPTLIDSSESFSCIQAL
ncbi:MAG: hypothetical protein K5681_03485 [Treponema sp.]|nr:hypothetical protein [Treponema sp.]